MTTQILSKIASRGYWKVVIRPLIFKPDRIASLGDCERLVADCKVSLRGWDYPHCDEIRSGIDYIWSETDWEEYKELWRFYLSGQFVSYFGCVEDWWKESSLSSAWAKQYTQKSLEIMCTLYRLTEIYEFASRLAQKGTFDEQAMMTIKLHGMLDRRLILTQGILRGDFTCTVPDLPMERQFSIQEIVARTPELAMEHVLRVLEWFNWRDVRSSGFDSHLRENQRKMLERRL